MAVGFGLSFVTGGTSLMVSSIVLAAVGTGMGAAGGVTNAGSAIVELCIQKGKFDTAQKIIDEDREAAEAIAELWEEIEKESRKIIKKKSAQAGQGAAAILKGCAVTGYKDCSEICH